MYYKHARHLFFILARSRKKLYSPRCRKTWLSRRTADLNKISINATRGREVTARWKATARLYVSTRLVFNINQIVSPGWWFVLSAAGSPAVSFVGQLSSIHRRKGKCHRCPRSQRNRDVSSFSCHIFFYSSSRGVSYFAFFHSLFLSFFLLTLPSGRNNYIGASRNSIHLD